MQKKQLDKDSELLTSISYFDQLCTKAKELYERIKKENNDIDPEKFVCVNKLKNLLDLASNIYRDNSSLKDAKNEQNEIKILLNKLTNYNPTKPKKMEAKKRNFNCCRKLVK